MGGRAIDQLQSLVDLTSTNVDIVPTIVCNVNVRTTTYSSSHAKINEPSTHQLNISKRALMKKRWKDQHKASINESERERKGRLTANIAKLKDLIPANKLAMQNKEKVIEEAVKYIKQLQQKIDGILTKGASDNLLNELKDLRKKVVDLEDEKKLYHTVLLSHGIPPILNTQQPWKTKVALPRNNKLKSGPTQKSPASSQSPSASDPELSSSVVPSNDTSSAASVNSPTLPFGVDKVFAATTTSVHTVVTTQKDSIVSLSSNDSRSSCFPHAKEIFPRVLPAHCTPTWSQARITPLSKAEIPTFSPIFVDSVPSASSDKTDTRSTTVVAASTAGTTAAVTHAKPAASSSTMIGAETDVQASYLLSATAEQASTDAVTVRASLAAPVLTVDSHVESPHLVSTGSTTSSIDYVPASRNLGGENLQSATVPPVSSSTPPGSQLFVWLRTPEDSVEAQGSSSSLRHPLTAYSPPNDSDASKAVGAEMDSSASAQLHKRTTVNSFNIDNLMKPTDESGESRASGAASTCTSFSRCSTSKEPPSGNENDCAATDLNAVTSDIFHRGLDNDLLDCLQMQMLSGLTTPEPPMRQANVKFDTYLKSNAVNNSAMPEIVVPNGNCSASRKRDQCMSVDLNDLLHAENPQCQQLGDAAGFSSLATRSNLATPRLLHATQNHLGKGAYVASAPVQNFQQNATSLWQPAIMEQTQSKTYALSDCFSPLTNQYPNSHQAQYGQSLRNFTPVMSQPDQHFPGSTISRALVDKTILTSSIDAPLRAELGARMDQVQNIITKKRKHAKSTTTSKRKATTVAKDAVAPDFAISLTSSSEFQQRLIGGTHVIARSTLRHSDPMEQYPRACADDRRRLYSSVQNLNPVVGHPPCMTYGAVETNYGGQSKLFHAPYSISQQPPNYPGPHGAYLPYGNRMPANQRSFVPGFANTNNNNSAAGGGSKPAKGSQHHIRQILG